MHIDFSGSSNKACTSYFGTCRAMGGIPPLVAQLNIEDERVPKAACGALRNLSYGKYNDENKVRTCQHLQLEITSVWLVSLRPT